MKILTISNVYPPDFYGGYELHCEQTVLGLRERGHQVEVLTARSRMSEPDPHVLRLLRHAVRPGAGPRWTTARLVAAELAAFLHNERVAQRVLKNSRPDLVMCWGVERVGLGPVLPAARAGVPVAYFVDDWSIAQEWLLLTRRSSRAEPSASRLRGLASAPLRRRGRHLVLEHVDFVADFMRRTYLDLGIPMPHTTVIHQGVRFPQPGLDHLPAPEGNRIIYVGRLVQQKGPHLAIEVLRLLRQRHGFGDVRLTMVGAADPGDPGYRQRLDQLVQEYGLTGAVEFMGGRLPAEIFDLLPCHRLMLFTSIWEEPGPASPLEAMGHGVPVVSSDVGGMPEYIRDGIDGLLVPRDAPDDMAAAAARLLRDQVLWERVRRAGWEQVRSYFSAERFITEVEAFLQVVQRRELVGGYAEPP
jgi:glycosyltransferase involved in cell wall biosynthesis